MIEDIKLDTFLKEAGVYMFKAKGIDIERYKKNKKSNKRKESQKKYKSQLCCYNNEIMTLCALSHRFSRAGIDHPMLEAKKYLLNKDNIKE